MAECIRGLLTNLYVPLDTSSHKHWNVNNMVIIFENLIIIAVTQNLLTTEVPP